MLWGEGPAIQSAGRGAGSRPPTHIREPRRISAPAIASFPKGVRASGSPDLGHPAHPIGAEVPVFEFSPVFGLAACGDEAQP